MRYVGHQLPSPWSVQPIRKSLSSWFAIILVSHTSPKYIDREGLGKRRKSKDSRIMTGASGGKALVACSRSLDSGEQVKSYAANAKRNTRGKKLGETGAGARKRP